MNTRRLLRNVFLTGILILTGLTVSVKPCQCFATPSFPDEFNDSVGVVTGRLFSIDRYSNDPDEDKYGLEGIRSSELIVETVYKGSIKKNQKIRIGQGWGADCLFTFDESELGKTYLFYFYAHDRRHPGLDEEDKAYFDEPVYWSTFCGRSKELKTNSSPANTDDLNYLENLDKYLGRTRIHGKVLASGTDPTVFGGIAVEIIGKNQTWKTTTLSDGSFEIFDLPPGRYDIRPELPAAWLVSPFTNREELLTWRDIESRVVDYKNPRRVTVNLTPGNHARRVIFVERSPNSQ
ncbi:MAG TPA: carboxypeptidase-like regulatory domain-containing protein [Aridibacter sp.]|nr:carboxypeptidase-like regulatory domain-containing protein [Aridibacter sp.]